MGVQNKVLDTLAAEVRRQYFKEWRAKNPDKVKMHNENYWRRKAEQKLKESEANNGG